MACRPFRLSTNVTFRINVFKLPVLVVVELSSKVYLLIFGKIRNLPIIPKITDRKMFVALVYIYLGLAIGYNVLSQIWLDVKGKTFAPTEPSHGFQVMTVVLILFAIRDAVPDGLFLTLFGLWTLSTIRFGIGNHIPGFNPQTYLNRFTWASALLINVFGAIVFTIFIVHELLILM